MEGAAPSAPRSRMQSVVILQHVACEEPGVIADALQRRGLSARIVRIHDGEPVPRALDGAALVVMGGPMGVYEADRYPHLRDELRLIEDAVRAGRPVLGVCLGSQLVAAALGARVYPGGYKEIGWYPVELSTAAADDPLFGDVPRRFTPLVWHGDVFDLPRGAVSLASSALTAHQAFRFGDCVYGLLFHLELSPAQLAAMVSAFGDEIAAAEVPPEAILDGAAERLAAVRDIGTRVFDRFAACITAS